MINVAMQTVNRGYGIRSKLTEICILLAIPLLELHDEVLVAVILGRVSQWSRTTIEVGPGLLACLNILQSNSSRE